MDAINIYKAHMSRKKRGIFDYPVSRRNDIITNVMVDGQECALTREEYYRIRGE